MKSIDIKDLEKYLKELSSDLDQLILLGEDIIHLDFNL
jgi:hypothetical protein